MLIDLALMTPFQAHSYNKSTFLIASPSSHALYNTEETGVSNPHVYLRTPQFFPHPLQTHISRSPGVTVQVWQITWN